MAAKFKKALFLLCALIIVVVVAIAAKPFYIVNEGEQVVVTRIRKIVATHTEAGAYFKIPFIDIVTTFPKKTLSIDGDLQEIQTKENRLIVFDVSARWRITDPVKFYQRFQKLDKGYNDISDIIDNACRTIITQNRLSEIVRSTNIINERIVSDGIESEKNQTEENTENEEASSDTTSINENENEIISIGRKEICKLMLKEASKNISDFGIEIIDIAPRKIMFNDKLTEDVYSRMIKDRNQVAQQYRSTGEGEKAKLLGKLENDKRTIESEAYRKAEEIKGAADAEAAKIYAEAYNKDPEFFAFWKSMESYKKTLKDFDATYSTSMDYFDYLYSSDGKR